MEVRDKAAAEAEIARLRAQIDGIDARMIELFERRMDIARELGRVKREHGMGIKSEYRELEVRANCRENCKNDKYRPYAESMMKCVMGAARGLQRADAPDYDDPWKYKYLELDVTKGL